MTLLPRLRFALSSLCGLSICAALLPAANAQFWDKLTKPQITVHLTHPPQLGLLIRKVAFGPANGPCADEVMDRLAATLIASGVEVVDQRSLQAVLAQQNLTFNGYVDPQSAVQMGKLLGPSVLISVRVSRCEPEKHRSFSDKTNDDNTVTRTYKSVMQEHLRGSLQTVDLATGKIFSAAPITQDEELANQSTERQPEFPSEEAVHDQAIAHVASDASKMFVKWNEDKQLFFFNDKECNLALAFAILKSGVFNGTVRQSEENIVTCKALPKVKDSTMAHAYYNAGLAYLLVNDHARAIAYLTESQRLKGGDIVTQTIDEANNSARLNAEMQRVEAQTQAFEHAQGQAAPAAQFAPIAPPAPLGAKPPADSVEERLTKIDALFKKGLISREEYEAKKKEILKDL